MLYDAPLTKVVGDFDRKWCSDDYFDIILWFESDNRLYGFQLLYDKDNDDPKIITYSRDRGLRCNRVDLGENDPCKNRTPIIDGGANFDKYKILEEFRIRGRTLPLATYQFIENALEIM